MVFTANHALLEALCNQTSVLMANTVIHPITGAAQTYWQLINRPDDKVKQIWNGMNCHEIGRLAQGLKNSAIKGTNTMFFIPWEKLPHGRKATYLNIVVDYRPQKSEPERVRWTVGGNLVFYPGIVSTPTADSTLAKILFNSVLSTDGATFHCFDVSNFYLGTPMDR